MKSKKIAKKAVRNNMFMSLDSLEEKNRTRTTLVDRRDESQRTHNAYAMSRRKNFDWIKEETKRESNTCVERVDHVGNAS